MNGKAHQLGAQTGFVHVHNAPVTKGCDDVAKTTKQGVGEYRAGFFVTRRVRAQARRQGLEKGHTG
ncbi:hypothetical protein GCM10010971_34310 [Silvimonas amylolytica]|uniref:Uncharacterized protein n=1 Tax=Silvimonas amylolytica TaxID=449663 RepID=A0ABQ2PPR6_9NEIS|nr:hypothetical protein GCM10010971_34310 [Silvimonas amylolytica]